MSKIANLQKCTHKESNLDRLIALCHYAADYADMQSKRKNINNRFSNSALFLVSTLTNQNQPAVMWCGKGPGFHTEKPEIRASRSLSSRKTTNRFSSSPPPFSSLLEPRSRLLDSGGTFKLRSTLRTDIPERYSELVLATNTSSGIPTVFAPRSARLRNSLELCPLVACAYASAWGPEVLCLLCFGWQPSPTHKCAFPHAATSVASASLVYASGHDRQLQPICFR